MNIQENDLTPFDGDFVGGGRLGVLLVHGLGGTPTELRFVANSLARAGHTVYSVRLAGHCGTPEELRRSSWQEWYASVEEAQERMREHCDVIVAGGLSMGGILAMRLAQKRPDAVHGLLLYAPTLSLDGWSMPWYSRALRYVRQLPPGMDFDLAEREPYGLKDERVRALVLSSMQSGDSGAAGVFHTPLRSFGQFNLLVADVRRDLGSVRQPALIVHPRHDDMASLKNAHYLQAHLGGLVDSVVLNDSYHMVTLDQQRHVVVERSVDFVARIEAAAKSAGQDRGMKGVRAD
jgi:carboxylesterase